MTRDYKKTLGCAAFLFALNAAITPLLFRTAYTNEMGSIEAAFIGIARWVSQHWGNLNWFPLWYGGIPYPDSYPPLLHWIVAAVITFSGASPGLAYHLVTAVIYCLGPVTLFWMAWRLCGSRECSLLAGIGYSLLSPSCLASAGVRLDSDGYFGARRLVTLVNYGEGPHLTSMFLLPLAIGMLHVALEKRKPWYWVSAALAVAAVPLSNWLGAMSLAICVLAYLFAGLPATQKTLPTLLRTAAIGLYAYAIALPWLSPATVAVIRANAPRVATNFQADRTQRILMVAVIAAFLLAAYAMERWHLARHTRFALLASLPLAVTALGRFWFRWSLLPQPERYHLEMDMFLWVALAFLVWPLVRKVIRFVNPHFGPYLALRFGRWLGQRPALVVALIVAIPLVPLAKFQRRSARWIARPIKIETTIEYKTAKWLDVHLPGARVFAPGTIGFWLNAFSDAPQLTGGFDNGIRNPFVPAAIFYTYAGDNQQYTVNLLRAYGVDAMIGGGKDSAEFYHPISHVEKLNGLKELWRDGGDVVYDIPRRSRSLAHVIQLDEQMNHPLALYGFSALDKYLAAVDNPAYPAAPFQWHGPSSATVTTDMTPEQILSVQIAFDKGWNVTVGGKRVHTWDDTLGQMVVEPRCSGPCTVEFKYDGGTEGRYARAVDRLSLAGGGLWILVAIIWRRRSGLTKTN